MFSMYLYRIYSVIFVLYMLIFNHIPQPGNISFMSLYYLGANKLVTFNHLIRGCSTFRHDVIINDHGFDTSHGDKGSAFVSTNNLLIHWIQLLYLRKSKSELMNFLRPKREENTTLRLRTTLRLI